MTDKMTNSLERLEVAVLKRLAWIGNLEWLGRRVKNIEPDHLDNIVGYCWNECKGVPDARDRFGTDVWRWNQLLMLYRFAKDRRVWAYWKRGDQEAYDLCFYIALHLGRIKSRTATRMGWFGRCPNVEKLYQWADLRGWTDAEGRGPVVRILESGLPLPWKST